MLSLWCFLSAGDKESLARSDDYGRDLSSVQTLLTKQETFDAGLQTFAREGIMQITGLKDQLIDSEHAQTTAIQQHHANLMKRWVLLNIFLCNWGGLLERLVSFFRT